MGKEEVKVDGHRKAIKDCQFSKDRTMFITASTDKECKVIVSMISVFGGLCGVCCVF